MDMNRLTHAYYIVMGRLLSLFNAYELPVLHQCENHVFDLSSTSLLTCLHAFVRGSSIDLIPFYDLYYIRKKFADLFYKILD